MKKKATLGKKLMLGKTTVARLNSQEQVLIVGGITGTDICTTRQISSCRGTSPRPGAPCCHIP